MMRRRGGMSILLALLFAGGLLAANVTTGAEPPPAEAGAPATDEMAERLSSNEMGRLITRFTYIAIIGVLLLCGMGLPLPEEVPILTSGVLARMGHLSPWPALGAVLFGVMAGDSMMFLLGRRWGTHLLEHRLSRRLLTRERQAKIATYFHQYGSSIIFVARFLPGLRAPIFLTAGSMRVAFSKFFLMDGLAALLSIPLSFWVAYLFTDRLKEMLELSHTALYWLLGAVVIGLIAGHFLWDRFRARRRAAPGSQADGPPLDDATVDVSGELAHAGGPAEGDHRAP